MITIEDIVNSIIPESFPDWELEAFFAILLTEEECNLYQKGCQVNTQELMALCREHQKEKILENGRHRAS